MFTNVVVSSDEKFKNFFPIVYYSWKKFFPDVKVSAIFITDRGDDDQYILYLKGLFDNFKTQKPYESVPSKNIAKIFRFLYAVELEGEISMIEDVDTIPLQRLFFEDKISKRPSGKILAVGRECYSNTPHYQNFPVSTITGESFLFRDLFNPFGLCNEHLINYYKDIIYGGSRSIFDNNFSDESFIRELSVRHNFDNFFHIERGVNIGTDWIDRSNWRYDKRKLFNSGYVTCNFKRPMEDHISDCEDIIEYIMGKKNNYKDLIQE